MKDSYERLLGSKIRHRKELSIVLDELGFNAENLSQDTGYARFIKSIINPKGRAPLSVMVCVDTEKNPGETQVYLSTNVTLPHTLAKPLGYELQETSYPTTPNGIGFNLRLSNLQNKKYVPDINIGIGLVIDDILTAYGMMHEGLIIKERIETKKRVKGKVIPESTANKIKSMNESYSFQQKVILESAEGIKRFKEEFYSVQH